MKIPFFSSPAVAGLFAVLLAVPEASAAISFDAAASTSSSDATSVSWQHAVGTGSDRMLVVAVALEDTSSSALVVSGVTYGGVAMTPIPGSLSTNGTTTINKTQLFYMAGPASGTAAVAVNFSGTVNGVSVGSVSFAGVANAEPSAVINSVGSGSTISTGVSVVADGSWLVDAVSCGASNVTFTPGSGQTERWDMPQGDSGGACSTRVVETAGSATMSWTASSGSRIAQSVAVLAPAEVVPPTPPSITGHPSSQSILVNNAARFTVAATGSAPLHYQWRKDGAEISGANSDTYEIASVQPSDAGSYDVVVSNSAGDDTSDAAILTVDTTGTAPTITDDPDPLSVATGAVASFSVHVSGTSPLSYQWRKDGGDISGAIASTYTINSAQASDAGSYDVVVTNYWGGDTSDAATLTVIPPPEISPQPESLAVDAGQSASFTAGATGTGTLNYQWRKDGADIPGADGSTHEIAIVQASDAGVYTLAVTGDGGTTISDPATLTVNTPPDITRHPAGQSAFVGTDVTFSVEATGVAPLAFKWFHDGEEIPGATSDSLVLTDVQLSDAGSYTVTVSNRLGEDGSDAAVLTVGELGDDLFVSPDGLSTNLGTIDSPMSIDQAVLTISPGGTIWCRGGTYSRTTAVLLGSSNHGVEGAPKRIFAWDGETPVFDFSAMATDNNNRGLKMYGNYWHVRGLIVEHAGDNGIIVAGHYNIVERCITRYNRDTGIQIARSSTSAQPTIDTWPHDNLVLNCDSYDNSDPSGENADGFACKLTSGYNNVFRGCVSHNNSDDGWDLYTNEAVIGPVLIEDCVAYNNGTLSDGTINDAGDRNGFKLGGAGYDVAHTIRRCIAYNNGHHGITDNDNQGAIQVINCTSVYSADSGYNFRSGSTAIFTNNASFGGGSSDALNGTLTGTTNVMWVSGKSSNNGGSIVISIADFQSFDLTRITRDADGSLNLGAFMMLAAGSDLIDGGTPAGTDIGARQYAVPVTSPSITGHPATQAATLGREFSLTVAADGTTPFDYQWRKDGADIPGATGDTYTVTAAQVSDAGSYTVVVSNAAGSDTSDPAVITITQGYDDWAADENLTGADALDDADPDHDGTPNLLEFALGMPGDEAGTDGLPVLSWEGGRLIYRFTRPSYVSGVTYTVQTSIDLVDWTGTLPTSVESSTASTQTLIAVVPVSGTTLFVRLRITRP